MRWRARTFLLVMSLGCTVGAARAQEPAASFEALAGRLHPGQQVWVTDGSGRERRGTLERISRDGLVLAADAAKTLTATDVRRVRIREKDSLKNGALIGLGVGAGLGTAWCVGAVADDSPDMNARVECGEGFTVFPALGALVGMLVDAAIPGSLRVVYQAPGAGTASRTTMTVTPFVSSRATGVAVAFAF